MRPAWVEVNVEALKNNIRNLKSCLTEGVDFMGVIKADAYGHGAIKVAEVLIEEGIIGLQLLWLKKESNLGKTI